MPHTKRKTRRVANGEAQRRLVTRDPHAVSRWMDLARMHRWDKDKAGYAPGSVDALEIVRSLTLVCRRVGCGALVDWSRAKAHATKTKSSTLALCAGCGGKRCAAQHKPKRFREAQHKMAQQLTAGKRVLAAWPRDAKDTEVWIRSEAEQAAAIARALSR